MNALDSTRLPIYLTQKQNCVVQITKDLFLITKIKELVVFH